MNIQTVYNEYTLEVEFTGTLEQCQEYIANYGGGWSALAIRDASPEEVEVNLL